MLTDELRRQWREFRRAPPGHRFRDWHQARAKHRRRGSRVLRVGLGVVLVAAGLFFMPAPGPGIAIFVCGAGVLAGEFLWVARLLDAADVQAQKLWRWLRRSPLRLAAAGAVVLAGLAGCGVMAWRVLLD